MKTLGGIVAVRNGNLFDYCWKEAVQSLLPVCEMVVLCIGTGGEDDTESEAREWMEREQKISICMYEWRHPKGDPEFWVNWLQYAKDHARTEYVFELDADEVLHEDSYPIIQECKRRDGRFSVWCKRLNFWHNSKTLIPPGKCVGDRVVRMMPKDVWMPSDGCHPKGGEANSMGIESNIVIGHYGFIRRPEAFFSKAKEVHGYFFNTVDERIEEAKEYGVNWAIHPNINTWWREVVPYSGTHPKVIQPWLIERGFEI